MRPILVAIASLQVLACASAPPRPSADDQVKRASVNGTEIAYVAEGTGPPVLIIHGSGGDYRSFSRAASILAARSRVVRVSLRLHWPNPWPASEQEAYDTYRVEAHAADLAVLIEKLGLSPVDVVGHSYGGVVAALLAQTRPDLVRRLVLVEPALRGMLRTSPDGEKFIQDAMESRSGALARLQAGEDPLAITRSTFDKDRPGTFDSLPELRRRILTDNARLMGPWETNKPLLNVRITCGEARRLAMPILVVEGQKTNPEFRAIDDALLGCLPDARRVLLPNAGHTIQFDAPEAMASAVTGFLGR